MASQIAEVKKVPFVILAIKDSKRDGYLSESKYLKIIKDFNDMSLKFAATYYSVVYTEEIESACENVLGIINLGLILESNNDLDKAKRLVASHSIFDFFRIAWSKITKLEKINSSSFSPVYKKFSLSIDDTTNSLKLFEVLNEEFLFENALKHLDEELVSKYYPSFYVSHPDDEIYEGDKEVSDKVCTIIVKSYLGLLDVSKGALNKTELLLFVDLSFNYSKEELIEKFSTNVNLLSLVNDLSTYKQKVFNHVLNNFLNSQLYPIDELYNIREANRKCNVKELACLISGVNSLDIEDHVMSDIASELSPIQRKKLNLGDDSIILD